jgi:superfamily II DNA helicase RecQ
MISELRELLPRDVVWFACSATLNDEAERQVLTNTGFRSISYRIFQTEIIRTSINRPNISLYVLPIPKG